MALRPVLRQHSLAKENGLQPVTSLLNPRARLSGRRFLNVLRTGSDEALKAVLRLAAEDCEWRRAPASPSPAVLRV